MGKGRTGIALPPELRLHLAEAIILDHWPVEIGVAKRIHTVTSAFTGHYAANYTMTTMKWSPWSDSHRRIRVYETRPVAAEAQGR